MRTYWTLLVVAMMGCVSEEPAPVDDTAAEAEEDPQPTYGVWEGTCSSDEVEPMVFELELEFEEGMVEGIGWISSADDVGYRMEFDVRGTLDDAGALELDFDLVMPYTSTTTDFDWPAVWQGQYSEELLDGVLVLGPLDPYPEVFEVDCDLTRVGR